MTCYKLEFIPSAWKEWQKLNPELRRQFHKKLQQRLNDPHIPSAKLFGMPQCYKIKLRDAGYRLVYQVREEIVTVKVIAIGKRDKSAVYQAVKERL